MKILVINIPLRPGSPVKMFPVGLAYIMTAMKSGGFAFDYLDIMAHCPADNEIERAIAKEEYDVVCFGCLVTGYAKVKKLSAKIREILPNTTIISGNTVASSIPELLLRKTEVDITVMGEGDVTIVELMRALQKGHSLSAVEGICYLDNDRFIRTPERPVIKDVDSLPTIDYSLFDIEIYITNAYDVLLANGQTPESVERSMYVNSARGCIGSCTFCYHAFQKKRYRSRSPQAILKEVAFLIDTYEINKVSFSDELTFFNKKQTLSFVEAIIDSGLKFTWGCQCRANLFDSEEDLHIIRRMKEAGCTSAFYSLETADPAILKAMNKKITVEQFKKQTELFYKAGMPVNTSLVFGYPQETPESIALTFDVCIEAGIYPSIGFLLPQPGSGMYDYVLKQGMIPDEESYLEVIGDRQDLYINLTEMPNEVFYEEVFRGAQKANKILKRGLSEENLIKTGGYKNNDFFNGAGRKVLTSNKPRTPYQE